MLEWCKNHQKETLFIAGFVFIVILFLVNFSIREMVAEKTLPVSNIRNQSSEKASEPQRKNALSSEIIPSGAENLAQNPAASVKPKNQQTKTAEEIIYEPSIKDNVLIQ